MNLKKGMRYVMAILFPLVGITHFTNSSFFLVIVPPALPWHTSLVYISGFVEILFGIGRLTKDPRLRPHTHTHPPPHAHIYAGVKTRSFVLSPWGGPARSE